MTLYLQQFSSVNTNHKQLINVAVTNAQHKPSKTGFSKGVHFSAKKENTTPTLLSNLLSKLITLAGGTRIIRKDIPDWDKLRPTTKIWRLLERKGWAKKHK